MGAMGVGYTYEPAEIRNAGTYLNEQLALLEQSHAANWRRKFNHFTDELTLRFESLKLLTVLLSGNRNVDTATWFQKACDGAPPPLPDKPYDLMALVWQQLGASVKKHGEGFFVTGSSVDLPYVLSCGFEGGSLGERFADWAIRYLQPFIDHIRAWHARVEAQMPEADSFDLWDLALALVNEVDADAKATPASKRKKKTAKKKTAKKTAKKKTAKKKTAKKKTAKKKTAKKRAKTTKK